MLEVFVGSLTIGFRERAGGESGLDWAEKGSGKGPKREEEDGGTVPTALSEFQLEQI